MTDPVAPMRGRGRGLGFRLMGIPVRIHLSFLLVLGFLGLQLGDVVLIVTWIAVGALSVLVHEFGHALAARAVGHRPEVQLAGMGGLTSYTGETSRWQQLAITAAGPALQVAGGLAVLPLVDGFGLTYDGDLVDFALDVWVVVSLLWGILNLVPMLPLDGGQLLRDLLPFGPALRNRVALGIGVLVAGGALLWALAVGDTWIALLAAFFGWSNLQGYLASSPSRPQPAQPQPTADELVAGADRLLQAGDARGWVLLRRAVGAPGAASVRTVAASRLVEAMLAAGRDREAYTAVADPRLELPLDETVVARALARHPNVVGVRRVVLAWARDRNDARARGIAAALVALGGDLALADQWLSAGPVAPGVTELVDELRRAGRP